MAHTYWNGIIKLLLGALRHKLYTSHN